MRPLLSLLAALAGLTACSAQSLATAYCGGAPPANNNPVVPQLLFPVPGTSRVPGNSPNLVVAYSLSPATAFAIQITPNGGAAIQLGPMETAPSPLPSPIANELVPGTPMYGVALPSMKGQTHYAVAYRDVVSYCGRTFVNNYSMGSFTTQ